MAGGMIVQAGGIWLTVQVPVYTTWMMGALLQGVAPRWCIHSGGSDLGYALDALISGVIADLLGMRTAIQAVAVLTLLSGLQVSFRMRETHLRAKSQPEGAPTPAANW